MLVGASATSTQAKKRVAIQIGTGMGTGRAATSCSTRPGCTAFRLIRPGSITIGLRPRATLNRSHLIFRHIFAKRPPTSNSTRSFIGLNIAALHTGRIDFIDVCAGLYPNNCAPGHILQTTTYFRNGMVVRVSKGNLLAFKCSRSESHSLICV